MHAALERLQKLQLVIATNGDWGGRKTQGHEDNPGEEETRACKAVATAMDDWGTGFDTVCGKHVRSGVTVSDPLMTHQICQILENLQLPAFEHQIREIDEAITGEAGISKKQSSAKSVLDISTDL